MDTHDPDWWRRDELPAECEELVENTMPEGPHDSDYLFIAAEEDFDKAVPLIVGALRNHRSADCRESAVWLLECYGDHRLARHVLRALSREHRFAVRVEAHFYTSFFLSLGEKMVKPLLEVWKMPALDGYTRTVAAEALARHLGRPIGGQR